MNISSSQLIFSWYDYILFCLMLLVSTSIGIYFAYFAKKQTANEYLMGGKTMNPFIISLSLIASHISGVTLLGLPADSYRYGGTFLLGGFSMFFVVLATVYIYLPVFYNLQITSLYEYLEMRFDKRVRLFVSLLYILYSFLIVPVVIYAAALAMSTATGLRMTTIVPLVCGICTFYTSIGGLKAVIWTDVFQFIITVGALTVVFVLGVKSVGGILSVWSEAVDNERLELFDFRLDFTSRDSFWTVTVGMTFIWLSNTSVYQTCVQKFLTVSTLQGAKQSVIWYCIGVIFIKAVCVLFGFVIYANYKDCDLFLNKKVEKNDQLVPYFVMQIAKSVPGLAGIFIAGIMSAGLSGLSANLNCVAGTVYVDFLQKFLPKEMSERSKCRTLKLIVVVIGFLCLGIALVMEHLGGIIALTMTFQAISNGPILGIFTLGLLFPRVNAKAVLYGALGGLICISAIVVPAKYYQSQGLIKDFPKHLSIEKCSNNTYGVETYPTYQPFILFRISYFCYCLIGALATICIGVIISFALDGDDVLVDKKLLSPFVHFLLPKEVKKYEHIDTALKHLEYHENKSLS